VPGSSLSLSQTHTHTHTHGSVLGPILFRIFINNLPLHIKNISVACDMLADEITLTVTCAAQEGRAGLSRSE